MARRNIIDDARDVLSGDARVSNAKRLARFARKVDRETRALIALAHNPHSKAALALLRNRLGLET